MIIAGGKALTIEEFLATRNNRGLKVVGVGESPKIMKIETDYETPNQTFITLASPLHDEIED